MSGDPLTARGELERVRNFGVVAHIDAGKTTLCERMLVRSGVEQRLGEVEDGTAVLDWMPEERERGISITAAATRLPWRGHQLHLIDTPGHVDFTIEVERSLRVLDGAVVVFDVLAGVQAQSEAVWRQMRRHGCAAVAFVNKLDRAGADFLAALAGIEKRLGVRCAPVAYPFYAETGLTLVADVLRECARGSFRDGASGAVPLPAGIAAEVGVLRAELAELLAEEDERLLECLAAGRAPAAEDLCAALRRRTLAGTLLPVACGSALLGIGVESALDLVVDCLPSPLDRPPVRATVVRGFGGEREVLLEPRSDQPVVAFAFKLQRLGTRDLVFVRVVRGTLRAGDELVVARTGAALTVRAVHQPHADSLEPVETAATGEIVALEGLEGAATGDTLCAPEEVCALEGVRVPEPVLALAVEPAQARDREELRAGLARLAREDPSLAVREDADSGQWILSGMGELHLEIALERLRSQTGLAVRRAAPRVAFREAPVRAVRAAARIERAFGSATLFGSIELEVEPAPDAAQVEVRFDPRDAPAPEYHAAIRASLAALASVGPAGGNPLFRARIVVRGAASERESEAGVLQAVGSAWHELLPQLEVEVHEPLMSFEVLAPSELSRGVIGDLQARGATLQEVWSQGSSTRIQGTVPLAGMFGYASAVRSLTQGRAEFSMLPSGTRAVPRDEWSERGLVLG